MLKSWLPSWSLWSLGAFIAATFVACQSVASTGAETSKEVSFEMGAGAGRLPDSTSWTFKGKSGTGKLKIVPGATGVFSVTCTLPSPPGADTVFVDLWTLSIHTGTLCIVSGVRTVLWKDTLGLTLLSRLDSLRKTGDSTRYQWSTSALLQLYAAALVDHDTLFKGFPSRRVSSFDTGAIYRAAIIYAASKRIPFRIISQTWLVGLDSASFQKRLAKLVAPAGPISSTDSLALFPPYPVRIDMPLSVASLTIGGESIPVHGSFVGDSGLSSYRVRVLQGTEDKSDLFTISTQPAQLDGSQIAWDLASNARLTLQVKTAEAGSYTLEVSITDPKGRSETSSVGFSVMSPPDKTGPNIEWVYPKTSILLDNKDSLLIVKIRASDSAGVDSVYINGMKAIFVDSSWTRNITVPVGSIGYAIRVESWDSKTNKSASTINVVRKDAYVAGAPIVELISPERTHENNLPFEVDSIQVSWLIKDPSGLDTNSILISGGTAVRRSDSVWSSVIRVPPTGAPNLITLQVKNMAGNQSTDYVVVTRQKDQVSPEINVVEPFGTRTFPYDSLTGFVQWRITDNHKLSKITINDSVVEGEKMLFGMLLALNVGANVASVIAEDSTGNRSLSKVTLTRNADTVKPRVLRVSDLNGRIYRWNDSSITVSWSVFEEGSKLSVLIQGDTVRGDAGVYSQKIKLNIGTNYIAIKAVDRAGNYSQDTVKVSRSRPLVRTISTRGGRTLALLDDGSIRLWGDSYRASLTIPDSIKNCIKISTGGSHYVAIGTDSTLITWGSNSQGQLNSPTSLGKVIAIAAGGEHTIALLSNGTVRAWGRNLEGQTNVPQALSGVVDIAAGLNFSAAITKNGSVYVWGDTTSGVGNVPNISNAHQIVAGNKHVLVLKADGSISAWGDNSSNQCLVPQKANLAKRIAAGAFHSMAILQDGTLAAWGRNDEKQLDIPQGLFNITDISVGNYYSIAVQNDGTLRGWGSNSSGQITFPEELFAP